MICRVEGNLLISPRVEEELSREVLNVPLKASARSIIEKIRDDTGVPKTEVMTRLLEWFAAQDRKFRLALLNGDAETKRELAKLTLMEMAALDGLPLSASKPEQLIAGITDFTEQLKAIFIAQQHQLHSKKPKKDGGQ